MDWNCKRIISEFSNRLKETVDLKKIRPLLEKRKIFTKKMLADIYDPSNNGDLFYDLLLTRGPYAFSTFLNILHETGHTEAESMLQNEYSKDYTLMSYKMTSDPIGFCLIIINEIFQNPKHNRLGSQVDATALESLFESLGYNVSVVWDLTGEEMKGCLRYFSRDPGFSKVDSIVVFILTHGQRINNCDVLYGTDFEVPVYVSHIYTMFDNNNCPLLLGKPKMFFFQACRGSKDDIGYYEDQYTSSDAVPYGESTDDDTVTAIQYPSMTDVIAVHSCLPNYTSLRDTEKGNEKGSWLCQDLVDVFSVYYRHQDLGKMLKSVSKKMEARGSRDLIKQTIQVKLFGVKGIVFFGNSKNSINHRDGDNNS